MFSSEGALFWGWEWGKFRNRCALRTLQPARDPCLRLLSLSLFLLSFSGYRVLVALIAVSISLGFSSAGGRQGADVKCVVESAAEKARCFELRAFRVSMLAVAGSKSTLQC